MESNLPKLTSVRNPHTMGRWGTDIKYATEFMQCMVLEEGDKVGWEWKILIGQSP